MTEQVSVGEPMRRSRWWPPLLLLAVIPLMVGVSVANAAEMMPPAQGLKASAVQYVPRDVPVDVIAAPTLSAAPNPATYIQQIEVILPPPPPATGTRAKRAQAITPGMTYTQFCDARVGALFSASSLSGLLTAANNERAHWGFAALSWSDSLAAQAQSWSQQMANDHASNGFNLSSQPGVEHFNANRATWDANVFRHSGYGAENIYFSYGNGMNASAAHAAWMKSPGHCKGLLNPNHRWFGAGQANATGSDGSYFATQRFS